jgi:hypothetical protein
MNASYEDNLLAGEIFTLQQLASQHWEGKDLRDHHLYHILHNKNHISHKKLV